MPSGRALTAPLTAPLTLAGVAALNTGGGVDYVANILGDGGLDYAEFDFKDLSRMFQDTAGTVPITTTSQVIGLVNVKAKTPHNASQSSSTFKPQYQSTGAKFDGSDDNLLSDWRAQAGENCIIAQLDLPATGNFMIVGSQVSGASRFLLRLTTGGQVAAGVGSDSSLTGVSDLRSSSPIVGVSFDGNTVRLFVNAATELTAAQNGAPNSTLGQIIGGLNNSGTPNSFFPGSIKRLAFGKKAITLAQFQQIRSQWLAA